MIDHFNEPYLVAYIYICETEQTPIDLINFDMFSKNT